jgi:hypothetical protein
MSWPIRLVTSPAAARRKYGFLPVGALWAPVRGEARIERWCRDYARAVGLRYLREHRHVRPPMFVKLPDGTEFCIDFCSSREIGTGRGEGWGCRGEPPAITLSPSINIIGSYHGWIQAGVISDDCEGRQFPNARGFPG